jgi:hypothetical protein
MTSDRKVESARQVLRVFFGVVPFLASDGLVPGNLCRAADSIGEKAKSGMGIELAPASPLAALTDEKIVARILGGEMPESPLHAHATSSVGGQ